MRNPVMREKIRYIYHITAEQENTTIDKLPMPDGVKSRAKRVGLTTIGDILDNWNNLNASKLVSDENKSQSLGETSIKAIHAATFAWLNQNNCVSKLVI